MKIISAFPGSGKTWLAENQNKFDLRILDCESTQFRWLENGKENPDFPQNYVKEIKRLMDEKEFDVVLVTSHKELREALYKQGIKFTYVLPDRFYTSKSDWLARFERRGNNKEFIKKIADNWYKWVNDVTGADEVIRLPLGCHVADTDYFMNHYKEELWDGKSH